MKVKRKASRRRAKKGARVCANCAMIVDAPVECCPRCNASMAMGKDDNLVDKTSADSFPASDPPSY